MGLMDKFKNLFTDEEIIEEDEAEPIEIKEIKKEEDEVHKLPTFMREKIEKEELEQNSILKTELEPKKEPDLKKELKLESMPIEEELPSIKKVEEKNSFKFPIDLNDNDFIETRSRQSMHNREQHNREQNVISSSVKEFPKKESIVKKETKVAELYKDKKKETKEEKKFKATPIISPIYGVLDKNYTPTDMESSKGENLETHRHSKNVDFDSVRKKAYGNLTEEIKENLMCENCEYLKEAKECQKEKAKIQEKNLVYDVLEDQDTNLDTRYSKDITLDEATENYYDYGVEYERSVLEPEEVKIVNHEEIQEHSKKEIPPVKSSINLLSTLKKSMGDEVDTEPKPEKDLELTDDLFNLIDSMYDERNDSK